MSFSKTVEKNMRGVNPPRDYLRPTKRPKFSDIALASSLPSARELARVEDSGGDISLKSNATLTMKFIGRARKRPRLYTQGTLLFYDVHRQDYLSLHEVNLLLQEEEMFPHGTDDQIMKDLIFFEIGLRFRYIGVFRNVMPGNDAARFRNLMSRQPLMGVDVTGRTNIMDLFERGQTADTVHLGLFPLDVSKNGTPKERFQFVPMMNWGKKTSKEVQAKLGGRHENAFCRCVFNQCVGMLHLGTVVRTPPHKILRNRSTAWEAERETQAQAMNLVEIIMA